MSLQTATNPTTGERVVLVGDQWKPITQSATNKQGVKAYLVDNNWITDDAAPASKGTGMPGPRTPAQPKLTGVLGVMEQIGAPLQAASEGIISGAGNVMFGGQELLGKGLRAVGNLFPADQTLSGPMTGQRPLNLVQEAGTALAADAARRRAEAQARVAPFKQEYPTSTGAGELAAEVAATAPVGAGLAAPLAKIAPALATAIRTGGFSTGRTVQGGAARAADMGIRAAGGAITGGTTAALINPADAETGAAIGAGVGAFAPGAVNLLVKGAGKIADVRQIPNQLAAKIARESLGSPEQIAAARAAMQQAQAEGLDLTAQQALARYGVLSPAAQATMEKAIKKSAPKGAQPSIDTRAAIEAAQESARKSTIQGVTPDLKAAIDARRSASQPLYAAADKAVVPLDAELGDVISRMPQGTLAAAANIAKMEGRPFIMGKTTPAAMVETGVLDAAGNPIMRELPGETAEITGESLHYLKRALSDIAYGAPTSQVGRDTQLAARGLLGDYTKIFETKVPAYGQARQIFSDLSAPVNQAQVLKEMLSVLEKPGGGERMQPFLNVLGRGEQAMLKRAGGRGAPRFESLSEVLTPEQLTSIREVAKQLETEAAIGTQITPGQQRASDLIKDELTSFRVPNPLNSLVTVANRLLETLGAKVGDKTIQKLADAAMSAKSFDEMLATLPANERGKVLKAISDPSTWAKVGAATTRAAAMPTAPANNLAPASENRNALAP
jgi:hypothetical protein